MSEKLPRPLRGPLSVRTHVHGLILVTLLPLLAFSAFLVIRSAEHEQEILASAVQDRTRAAARDIEREIGNLRSQLFVVASAKDLYPENFAAFYGLATTALGRHGLALVLSRPDGTEVLDTRLPLGAPLPDNPDRAAVRHVVDIGVPYVSDLTTNPVTHAPAVMILVPIRQNGTVAYVASLDVMPSIEHVLARQQVPASWLATIIDRQGYTLARTRDPEQFIGQPSRPAFLRRMRESDEGWFPWPSRDGIRQYVAFSHVNPVGWSVIIGIPLDLLYAPVRRSTEVIVLVGATTLGVALMLATLIGHRIAEPIAGLVTYAQVVGQGELVAPRRTGLRETDAVACSLYRASQSLHASLVSQAQATAELHASEERKQLLHQVVLAQEGERKRIARELHDSLGQYLTALQLGLSAIGRRFGAAAGMTEELAKLRSLTADIGTEVIRMAWEMRPTALDDLGLETAIAQYLEEWGERSRLHFDLQISLGNRRLPQTVETTVYRALQEAVTNVVRHADADNVAVIIDVTDRQLQLIVEDDGKGFAFPASEGGEGDAGVGKGGVGKGGIGKSGVAEAGVGEGGVGEGRSREGLHLGLLGMRERLALVDGSLEVESSPGAGTTLFVRVPV